jgi:hypothetical protein
MESSLSLLLSSSSIFAETVTCLILPPNYTTIP